MTIIDRPDLLAEYIVEFMNELLSFDGEAIDALCRHRVVCNEALAGHATVQVGQGEHGEHRVGLLGILNGLCGVQADGPLKGQGRIAIVYEEGDSVPRRIRFQRHGGQAP